MAQTDPRDAEFLPLLLTLVLSKRSLSEKVKLYGEGLEKRFPDITPDEKSRLLDAVKAAFSGDMTALQIILSIQTPLFYREAKDQPVGPALTPEYFRERDALIAAHEKARVKRGLQPEADTGEPEHVLPISKVPFLELPTAKKFPKVPIDYRPGPENILEAMDRLPLGHSRFGGLPDLPDGIQWPKHKGKRLRFLAQVNLSELRLEDNSILPKDGHLFFFALPGKKMELVPYKVLLHRGPAKKLIRQNQNFKVAIWPDSTGQTIYELVPVGDAPRWRGFKMIYGGPHRDIGHVFGQLYKSHYVESPGGIADLLFFDGDDWINFLELQTESPLQWAESGNFCILIRKSALHKLDFSNLIATVY